MINKKFKKFNPNDKNSAILVIRRIPNDINPAVFVVRISPNDNIFEVPVERRNPNDRNLNVLVIPQNRQRQNLEAFSRKRFAKSGTKFNPYPVRLPINILLRNHR